MASTARLLALGAAIPQFGDGLAAALPTNRAAGPFRIDLTATRPWGGAQIWTDNIAHPATPPFPPSQTPLTTERPLLLPLLLLLQLLVLLHEPQTSEGFQEPFGMARLLLLVLLHDSQTIGCPTHRAFAMSGNVQTSPAGCCLFSSTSHKPSGAPPIPLLR